MDEFYSYKEVADKLKLSERRVWDLVNKDKSLKAFKAGNQVRISETAIREFIQRSEIK